MHSELYCRLLIELCLNWLIINEYYNFDHSDIRSEVNFQVYIYGYGNLNNINIIKYSFMLKSYSAEN